MSSIDAGGASEVIRAFHAEQLMPAGEALRRNGKTIFPMAPDSSQKSYYVERRRTTMEKVEFEVYGPGSVEELERAMADLWMRQGLPELARLAPGLSAIARAAYFVEDRDAEVSPFMYVMF